MKPKKCKICKEMFTPGFCSTQIVCSYICALEHAKKDTDKKQKAKDNKWKKDNKPLNTLKSEAQKAVNEYVRYRDKDELCINESVAVAWNGNESDAAHFVSRAANNAMRFDLRNIHKSTKKSNANQEKHIHAYRENLIERLGEDRFNKFEEDCKYWRTHKRNFSKDYLERVKRIFRKKKRVLMKIRGDI